jgi:hypothetical protein
MNCKLPDHVLNVLKEAYFHLQEHNREYHHITPQELLDKINKILEDDKNTEKEP